MSLNFESDVLIFTDAVAKTAVKRIHNSSQSILFSVLNYITVKLCECADKDLPVKDM